ncbi:hypothetical protein SPRG_10576 [Saprolegnia parasitica CBS 223.65]|uniref:Uncharacterized protein n=1 Tax=Saprolegnia parasitica (strain CBS 223.65) TaxID=695850 RepID=A0A067C051_SAPPC|nr:hypothetical protein SPRG_10576 [Saprolegnia parasitica CBS 223.65]KDO24149.1 hypothetical protein SPRG_10576 [Saprolegnia parasitica CBS 223.65]|eukprot:XP_012205093.1 hypothetical protein SPRG_10576 [Saprolegnia parasitica CBS 223.65]
MEILSIAFAISAALTLLTVLLSGWEVWTHLLYNPQAGIRRYVLRILLMVPIYAVTSYLALTIPEYKIYFETIRDFYEAFALHSFYYFMIEFLGGQEVLAQRLRSHKHDAHHVMGFQWCLNTWKMGPQFVRMNTLGILQYIPSKIFITVMTFVSIIFDFYGEGEYTNPLVAYGWLTLILTVSQTWALYCLVLFYHGCLEELAPMKPFPKFMAIKMIIFFTFWQSCTISALGKSGVISESWHIRCKSIECDPISGICHYEECWETAEIGAALNNFIVCVEMLLFAVVHHYAFKIDDFLRMEREKNNEITNNVKNGLLDNLLDAISITDVAKDIQYSKMQLLTEKQRLALVFEEEKKKRKGGGHGIETAERSLHLEASGVKQPLLAPTAGVKPPARRPMAPTETREEARRRLATQYEKLAHKDSFE